MRSAAVNQNNPLRPVDEDVARTRKRGLSPQILETALQKKKKSKRVHVTNKDKFEELTEIYKRPPLNLRPCDVEDFKEGNLGQCVSYVDIILKRLKCSEKNAMANPDYFEAVQKDIKPRMRTILYCWLVEVHQKFKLKEPSLWSAFQICDIFLSKMNINRNRLQLVGSCSLWIACKYHEIYPPLAKDFVYISDRAFKRQDLIKCEELMCDKLKFNFSAPTVYRFAQRYVKVATHNIQLLRRKERVRWLTFYACERVALQHESLAFTPSVLAAGAVCSALGMTGRVWTQEMIQLTGYTCAMLKDVTKLTRKTILKFDDKRHQAVITKYECKKRGCVSQLRRKDPSRG